MIEPLKKRANPISSLQRRLDFTKQWVQGGGSNQPVVGGGWWSDGWVVCVCVCVMFVANPLLSRGCEVRVMVLWRP